MSDQPAKAEVPLESHRDPKWLRWMIDSSWDFCDRFFKLVSWLVVVGSLMGLAEVTRNPVLWLVSAGLGLVWLVAFLGQVSALREKHFWFSVRTIQRDKRLYRRVQFWYFAGTILGMGTALVASMSLTAFVAALVRRGLCN